MTSPSAPSRLVSIDLLARTRAIAVGLYTPTAPRDAATVVLLRNTAADLEVYLLRRTTSMAFAAGRYAFPGGAVDPRDADGDVAWVGPAPTQWSAQLQCGEPLARALACAAVRETFEECGVLLAGADEVSVVSDISGTEGASDRVALSDRSLALRELLARRGLVLRADLLAPWSRWITPEAEPKRFDTRFFLAALPAGQLPGETGSEADRAVWLSPRRALEAHQAGELPMLPPTVTTLAELTAYRDVADALDAGRRREIRPVLPRVVVEDNSAMLRLPGEAGYDL